MNYTYKIQYENLDHYSFFLIFISVICIFNTTTFNFDLNFACCLREIKRHLCEYLDLLIEICKSLFTYFTSYIKIKKKS